MDYPNGEAFEGHFMKGVPHGFGKHSHNNGSVFEGDMWKGQRHGRGSIAFKNGESYTGDFKDGEMTGLGATAKACCSETTARTTKAAGSVACATASARR
jgi:hypothetical protein